MPPIPALPDPSVGATRPRIGRSRGVLVLTHDADRLPRHALAIAFGAAAVLLALGFLLPILLGAGPADGGRVMPRAAARTQLRPAAPVELVIYDTDVMPIAADTAIKLNADRPVDIEGPQAAVPFTARWTASTDPHRAAAVDCLATAIYYEAASEPEEGQRAVAQVVLNRVRHPAFPNTVCGVVYQGSERITGCQFSFTCDGSMARLPSRAGLARAQRIATEALSGTVAKTVGNATHYHANYVVPYWSPTLDKVATIGAHIFYVMRGSLGTARAFRVRYDPEQEVIPAAPAAIALDPIALDAGVTSDTVQVGPGVLRPQEDLRAGTITAGVPGQPFGGTAPSILRADEGRGELLVGKARGITDDQPERAAPQAPDTDPAEAR